MLIRLIWIEVIFLVAFTWVIAASNLRDLNDWKRQWDECCESGVCIGKSCYSALTRESNWATLRQRCQGYYPDWPHAVDVFRLKKQLDIASLTKSLLQGEEELQSLWTSGTRCFITGPEDAISRWTSTNESFPEWLTSTEMAEEYEGCRFLVIYLNDSDLKYSFQDQTARHGAICEFMSPFDVDVTNEINFESTTSSFSQWTKGVQTEQSSVISSSSSSISYTIPQTTSNLASSVASKFCKRKTAFGIDWPDALPGEVVNKSCPAGMIGIAQWTCSKDTFEYFPAKPYIFECKHSWIKRLEDEIENGFETAISISDKLANQTKNQDVSHGDITALVNLSTKLLSFYKLQNDQESKPYSHTHTFNFTTSMVASMSNILRDEIKDAWEVLPQLHQTRAASSIMKLVTNMGSYLSCMKKSEEKLQFTVSTENIDLQTFIMNSTAEYEDYVIRFPEPNAGVDTRSSISVPIDLTFENSLSPCKNAKSAVGVVYKRVAEYLETEHLRNSSQHITTEVISFALNNDSETSISLPNGTEIRVVLEHSSWQDIKNGKLINPRCVFWNFSKQEYGEWDSSGCFLLHTNLTHFECSCDHLTNFAVLMDVNNNIVEDNALSILTYICCGVSSLTLIATLTCFITMRSLHSRRSIITGNLCLCLLITNALILFGLDRTENTTVCAVIAGFLHFWILSAFCWMLIEGYHLYRMVILVFERGTPLSVKMYYAFAYGCPLIVVGISASVRPDSYGNDSFCWLSQKNGLMWSFVGPACIIIVVNIVIFILTMYSASSVKIKKEQTTLNKIKGWTTGSISVMCLLGLTWCIGFFYTDKKLSSFSYIFTFLNGSQGVFIFLFHVVLNKKVQKSAFFKCKDGNPKNWRKFLPQSSGNRFSTKTSTTIVNGSQPEATRRTSSIQTTVGT